MFWADQFAEERISLLALEGRLSGSDLVNLSDRLRGLAAQGVFEAVVDLREVEHWDYRGLTGLAEAVRFRRRYGASTAFITPDPYLRDIAHAVGVGEDFDFFDDLLLTEAPRPFTVIEPLEIPEQETPKTASL